MINPIQYLKTAWNDTHSTWGKFSIVVFYTFIWFQIVSSIQGLFFTSSVMNNGCHSFDDSSEYLAKLYLKQISCFNIGFLLYADRGGIKLWNISTVVIIYAMYEYVIFPTTTTTTCHETSSSSLLMNVIWPIVAFVCAVIDTKMPPPSSTTTNKQPPPPLQEDSTTTSDESTPLMLTLTLSEEQEC